MISTTRLRQVIDVVVTAVMGIAAALIIWRMLPMSGVERPGAVASVVEDVEAQELVTSIADTPLKGDPAARVVLIEFSDFQCPFCRRHSEETFDRIERQYVVTGKIQYAFRHLPLDMHSNAVPAAEAAECAAAQGKFWEMRRHLFAHQSELKEAIRNARELELVETSYEECLRGATADKVRSDRAEATRLGAKATPTVLVGVADGKGRVRVLRKVEGARSFEAYRDAIDDVVENQ